MVWTGVPRAVLLLFLLSSEIWDVEGLDNVDLKALNSIAKVINVHASQTASPPGSRSSSPVASGAVSQSGHTDEMQYAMAVRIAKNQCLQNFNVNNLESLKREVSDFKNKLDSKVKDVYKGNLIVAARYTSNVHSEYRLLMEGEVKVIEKLLETTGSRNDEDCVIFYTYNSPCLKTCLGKDEKAKQMDENRQKKGLTPKGKYKCIYPALDIFNRVSGPKAFVFTRIYREDMNKEELSECLGKITEKLPLYQCDNNNRCRLCDQGNSYCTVTDAGADLAG